MSTTIEAPPSMSLEEAITEYIITDARMSELQQRKKRLLEILIPTAQQVRGKTNTTRLTSSDQQRQLKVVFGSTSKCDVNLLNTVKEMLGDDVFESLFKLEYAPRWMELKPFLATKSTDERIETAKTIIKEAMTEVPKTPQLTIEKGRIEV